MTESTWGGLEPFQALTNSAGLLMSIAGAILLNWRGRIRWEPSEEDLPGALDRLSRLLTAVSLALILTHMTGPSHVLKLTTLIIATIVGCLSAVFTYIYLIGIHSYSFKGRRIIGGILLKPLEPGESVRERLKEAGDPDQVWSRRSRVIMKLGFGLCYFLINVLGSLSLVGVAILKDYPLSITITAPPEGSAVDQLEDVEGVSKNLPDDVSIWIIVVPWETQNYCPQKAADLIADGKWSSLVNIGVSWDHGKRFDVLAVAASQQASRQFEDYVEKTQVSETHPGMRPPSGTRTYSRVTVLRN